MVTLRQLAPSDAAEYQRLRLQGLAESPTAFGASYAREVRLTEDEIARRIECRPERWVTGAWAKGQLVGLVGFSRSESPKSHHLGMIWGMYVAPPYRRQGLGQRLLEDTLARTDLLPGLRGVKLAAVTTNRPAVALYERAGFVIFGTEPEALFVDGVYYAMHHLARPGGAAAGISPAPASPSR